MSGFKFNLGKDFEDIVNEGLKDMATEKQQAFDALSIELNGKSLDEAKRRVKQEWESDGGELTDPELTEYAELLIDGGRINFNATPYKFDG